MRHKKKILGKCKMKITLEIKEWGRFSVFLSAEEVNR